MFRRKEENETKNSDKGVADDMMTGAQGDDAIKAATGGGGGG